MEGLAAQGNSAMRPWTLGGGGGVRAVHGRRWETRLTGGPDTSAGEGGARLHDLAGPAQERARSEEGKPKAGHVEKKEMGRSSGPACTAGKGGMGRWPCWLRRKGREERNGPGLTQQAHAVGK